MKKSLRKLSLHRETLRRLNPDDLRVAGADNKDPYTATVWPTQGPTCTCPSIDPCITDFDC